MCAHVCVRACASVPQIMFKLMKIVNNYMIPTNIPPTDAGIRHRCVSILSTDIEVLIKDEYLIIRNLLLLYTDGCQSIKDVCIRTMDVCLPVKHGHQTFFAQSEDGQSALALPVSPATCHVLPGTCQ